MHVQWIVFNLNNNFTNNILREITEFAPMVQMTVTFLTFKILTSLKHENEALDQDLPIWQLGFNSDSPKAIKFQHRRVYMPISDNKTTQV